MAETLMAKNTSKEVEQGILDGTIEGASEAEVEAMKAICEEHHANPAHLILITSLLQAAGFGRNEETWNALRAVADLMESDAVPRAEDLERQIRKKRH